MKKIKYQHFFNLLRKNIIVNSLIFIMLGIFLCPNFAFASEITEKNIIELTNIERSKNNLNELKINTILTDAAYEKGKYIFETQTFAHNINGIKFSNWVKDKKYEYSYVGENLAIDFSTSEGAISAWLDSPTHRKNILNERYDEIGVAVLRGNFDKNGTTLIVQIFASPLKNYSTNFLDNSPHILGTEEIKINSEPTDKYLKEKIFVTSSIKNESPDDIYLEILFLLAIFLLILNVEFGTAQNTIAFMTAKKGKLIKHLPKQTYKLQKHLKNASLKTKENI